MINHSGGVATRFDERQDLSGFQHAEGLECGAMSQGEDCPQIVVVSDEGNFLVLDDTIQRYSDTFVGNSASNAHLEGYLRVLQSIVGDSRSQEI